MSNMFPVAFTDEEASVILTLMQTGARALTGESFDQGTASYLHLRKKILDARTAAPKVEEVLLPPKAEDAA